MSGLFQKKEKLHREPVRWKKELKLAPGYLILTLWILFTLALLGWVLLASFSTTKEIFSNKLLDSGFHIENYVKAWVNSNVSTIFFTNTVISCGVHGCSGSHDCASAVCRGGRSQYP